MCLLCGGAVAALSLVVVCFRRGRGRTKKIFLVLHSFHQGYECTDSVQQGILDELAPRRKDVSLSVEYLDSIRYPEASHLEAVHELFCELPVVFRGVNEAISVRETIEIALKLRPSAKTVAVVAGSGPAEIRNLEMAKAAKPFFKGRVAFEYLYGFEPEEIANRLKERSSEDIVLYLSYLLSPSGKRLSVEENRTFVLGVLPSSSHDRGRIGRDLGRARRPPLLQQGAFLQTRGAHAHHRSGE